MQNTQVQVYRQNRDEKYLDEHPEERWRCDLLTSRGTDHHGVGATESEAILHAAQHFFIYEQMRVMPKHRIALSDVLGAAPEKGVENAQQRATP